MKSKIERMLSIVVSILLMVSQANVTVFANEDGVSEAEAIEEKENEIVETVESVGEEELVEGMDETKEDWSGLIQIDGYPEDNEQATIEGTETVESVEDASTKMDGSESTGQMIEEGNATEGETVAEWEQGEVDYYFVITEGSYTKYVRANGKFECSFTPSESGWYVLHSNADRNSRAELYSSSHGYLQSEYGDPNFWLVARLEAGETYYYEVGWYHSNASGEMEVTLEKYAPTVISEGTLIVRIDAGVRGAYSFTPAESGLYMFRSNAGQDGRAYLYDSDYGYLKSADGWSNLWLVARLEADETYFYEAFWDDPYISGEMEVTLEKYGQEISEGMYNVHIDADEISAFSFTPDESGLYMFRSNVDQASRVYLYDSGNRRMDYVYGYPNFRLATILEAGATYYYEACWYDSSASGEMEVTLEKYAPSVISEGVYTSLIEAGGRAAYSFTPDESGLYVFRSNVDQASRVYLYDSVHDFNPQDAYGYPNFWLVASLEAGVTYYYEAVWSDSSASGEMEVTLQKYAQVISEGTLTVHIDAGERTAYSFTPDESGLYVFRSNASQYNHAELYDADHYYLQHSDGNPNFRLVASLKAGATYYYEAFWNDSSASGEMDVTLEKYTLAVITEGTYTVLIEAGERAAFSFTPDESGIYVFHSNAGEDSHAELYDSSNDYLQDADGWSNFWLAAILEAGETYYYETFWYGTDVSGEMEVTLEKYAPAEITEGTYTVHLDAGERHAYSFTPSDSGRYLFRSGSGQDSRAELYDSGHDYLQDDYGYPNFWLVTSLEAGVTYYYEICWYDSSVSGDMEVTLEKYAPAEITEGTRTVHLGAGERAMFSFTPVESGRYVFRSNADESSYAELYDSDYDSLQDEYGWPNFRLVASLEAGTTYYYKIGLNDFFASGDIEILLEKYASTAISEGTRTVHIGAGEKTAYSFTPGESGMYVFRSNTDKNSCAELYDSDHYCVQSEYANPNFWLLASLDAGETYYYETFWYDSDVSGDMEVTLEKYAREITEGTYTVNIDAGECAAYSFTPDESGMYVFRSNASRNSYVILYDSNHDYLQAAFGDSNFRLVASLEAGETYYYETRWSDSVASGDMEVTLEKYAREITEGTRTFHLDAGERVAYSFTPSESGWYVFRSNADQECYAELYDSSHDNLQYAFGDPNFWLVASLEAGATYYYETWWWDSDASGDMEVTLEKYTLTVITEGTRTVHIGAGERAAFSFTPSESGLYEFCGNADHNSRASLYNSNYSYLQGTGGDPNFWLVESLEAGATYYYETCWYDSAASGDMEVSLEKYTPTVITEGRRTVHIGAGERATFSFTPDESGRYVFRSGSGQDSRAELYDSGHDYQQDDCGYPNFRLVANLEAGVTYYYEAGWRDSDASGDMDITLEKYEISEGTHIVHIGAGERVEYSFTPVESGLYVFRSNADESSYAELYDSDYDSLQDEYGWPNFRLVASLEAGTTYYYEVSWSDSSASGDMEVTLEKYAPTVITEGTRSVHIGAGEMAVYSFTPDESGWYVFRSVASQNGNAMLYNSSHKYLKGAYGNPNFWLLESLEAGATYYYETCWSDSYASGDMEVTLEKYAPPVISEGTHTVHIGAGERITYSFTPVESGLYVFSNNADQYSNVYLYDSGYGYLQDDYGYPNFWLVTSLEAGVTYYYEICWYDSSVSGDMEVTLEKYAPPVISEGMRTDHFDEGERPAYSFTPRESGLYVFHGNFSLGGYVDLYDSGHANLQSEWSYSNFWLLANLEAGTTYYYEVRWYDSSISGDMEVTLEKYAPPVISEGMRTVHSGEGERAAFSFTPGESGLYVFHGNSDQDSHAFLYDSNHDFLKYAYVSSTYWLVENLEAGTTYYYETWWDDSSASGDMEVMLEKYAPIEISEGTYTVHIGAGERAAFSFTPVESGLYVFQSNGDNGSHAEMYDSSHDYAWFDYYGLPNFRLAVDLEAGETYYYEIEWSYHTASGDMEVTLETSDSSYTGFKQENSRLYWYENGIRQGDHGDPKNIWNGQYGVERGREIYDPETNGWYWLDTGYGGAVARDCELWLPYILQDEEPGSTDGKWVRYDKDGHRIGGWYTNDYGTYYYDLATGAMLRGEHDIDGVTYFFDEISGVLIHTPLEIIVQPQSLKVSKGEKAEVSVEATGDGLTYQWYLKNRTATKFTKSSVTKSTYSVTMGDAVNGRQVYCVIIDRHGDSVTTDIATLSQTEELSIVTQPVDATVANGEKAVVTVEATGEDLTYQWYLKNRTATKFTKSSVTKATYSTTMSDSVDGRQVYCVITDSNGDTLTTDTVTLHKYVFEIVTQPQDVTVDNGEKANVTVEARGEGLTYQWYVKARTATKFSKSSVTKATYSTTMSDTVDGRQVYCVVTDKNGDSITTDTVTLSKYVFEIISQPQDATVDIGEKASVTVEARGEDLTYAWYLKGRTATKFTKSSVTKATYSVTMSDTVDGRQVYCVVTDKNGDSITTDTVTLSKYVFEVVTQPQDVTADIGEKASVTVEAKGVGLTYQWYIKNKTATKFSKSSITKATYSVTMSDTVDGRQVYCVVTDKNGDTITTDTVTLSKYVFKIISQPQNATAKNGEKVSTTVEAKGEGLTYTWYIKNRTATKFTKSSVTKATYSTTMSDTVDGRQVYCVISDKNGDTITTDTVTLGKSSGLAIVSEPEDALVESGQKAVATVVAEGEGLTYQWYIKHRTATKFSKSSVTKATYSVTMSDTVDGRQAYCVVTDKDGNSLTTRTVTFTMFGFRIIGQPADVSVAAGEKAQATVHAIGNGLTYQWYIKNRTASKFSKSSVTKATYSVTMSDTVNGRQAYCIVTDENGEQLKTDTVTFTMIGQ